MITIKHDNKLKFPPIVVPMISQDDEDNTHDGIKQSNVEGIFVPLFRFNNLTINFQMVRRMQLSCSPVPEIYLEIDDIAGMIKNLDTPGLDNVLYMQILPPFDNAYKKIELAFFVWSSEITGNIVQLRGKYTPCNQFNDVVMKSYGMIDTYTLFNDVSNELCLGFASNIDGSEDKRYIYNPNLTPTEFLQREIRFGGNKEHVFDWWVDFWNNLVLVDIYEEYNTLRPENDMKIWISTTMRDMDSGAEPEPFQTTAAFTNHPAMMSNPLFISSYKPIMVGGSITDCNFETYSMDDQECSSLLIQDGDVHHSVITRYIYGGEKIGEFDYLGQRMAREMFRKKIYGQCIEVSTKMPLLSLIKGDKVNVWWYDINSYMTEDVDNQEISTNSPVPENEVDSENSFIINKTISGQYYILDVNIDYDINDGWTNTFKLGRSAENIQRLNPPKNESYQ